MAHRKFSRLFDFLPDPIGSTRSLQVCSSLCLYRYYCVYMFRVISASEHVLKNRRLNQRPSARLEEHTEAVEA